MLKGSFGTKTKSQSDSLLDRLVVRVFWFIFARGWIGRSCVWDPSPGLGYCASEPSHASTARIPCVGSAGAGAVISNAASPHFPCALSRAC